MTIRPGDDTAGEAGRGRLRASHADREQVIGTLKTAYVRGMLTKDELDLRVGQTLASRTYAELAALTADLPAELITAPLPQPAIRAQARPPMSNAAKAGICVVIAVAVAVVVSIPTGGAALFIFAPFYFMALLVAGAQILASRYEKPPRRGQLPPGPASGRGDQASPPLPSADPGRQFPPTDPGPRHTAEAAPSRRPRPPRSPRTALA